jgi:hypothetical protein
MAYHNHFMLNSLGGNPKSAMPVLSLCPFTCYVVEEESSSAQTILEKLDMTKGDFDEWEW